MEADSGDLSKLYKYFVEYRSKYNEVGNIPLIDGEIDFERMREIIDCKLIKLIKQLAGHLSRSLQCYLLSF